MTNQDDGIAGLKLFMEREGTKWFSILDSVSIVPENEKEGILGSLQNVINVKWDASAESVYDWVYVDVANVGVMGPYFVEGYYTFLRNNSLIKYGDKVISMLTSGKYTNLLEASLDSNNDITASMIDYYAGLIYNSMILSVAEVLRYNNLIQ